MNKFKTMQQATRHLLGITITDKNGTILVDSKRYNEDLTIQNPILCNEKK